MNLAQQLVNGLVIGSGYACVALGWTILLGAARLVNFAHGQMYMLGAFLCWFLLTHLGLAYPVAALLSIGMMAILGLLMQLSMTRLVLSQNLTSLMIVTLGFGYIIQGAAGLIFGGAPHSFSNVFARQQIRIQDVWFTAQDALVLGITLVLYLLTWLFLNKTRPGSMVRAIAEDPKLAQLFGIDSRLVYVAVFIFEAVMVTVAAVLVAPRTPILTSMGFEEVIITFVIVVLGGIGNVAGALVAGLGLGLFTALFGAFISPAYATAAIFAALLVLLTIRPAGLATR